MKVSFDSNGFQRWHEAGGDYAPAPDVQIVTSGGLSIPAHSTILASASPVLETKLDRQWKNRNSERVIQILGVPFDAVINFVRILYASESAFRLNDMEEAMDNHGVHLLVLSHAYRVGWLKRVCEDGLAARLTANTVVDLLQLARQCDASRLHQKCMRLIGKDFEVVSQTETWRFVQSHDLRLELEILQFLQEGEERKKKMRRERAEREIYEQLNEAMECLQHICTEGCTDVGPHDGEPPSRSKGPCTHFRTCEGLQLLIRHFAKCGRKLTCAHCKRMWQLFRLHSSICNLSEDACKVPLCKQFKSRIEMVGKGDEADTWSLLVRKVIIARVMSSLSQRKRIEQLHRIWARYRRTR